MNNRKIQILCTVGPSTLHENSLKQMKEEGVDLLRINLSHTPLEKLPEVLSFIQTHTDIPVCIDSEGAQLRTGVLKEGSLMLEEGDTLKIFPTSEHGTSKNIHLNHDFVLKEIPLGEIIFVDFHSATLKVIGKEGPVVVCRVETGGKVGSNKALNLTSHEVALPALTLKDKAAIGLAKEFGIKHFALSFANTPEDCLLTRKALGDGVFLISKIETNRGLKNLDGILKNSNAILMDRGDLSREQPIQKIPFWQKKIIATAKRHNKEVYVATNLLESMVSERSPTRAEVCDIANALLDGVDGLVLAAETAIGRYPILCVQMVKKVIEEFRVWGSMGTEL